MKIGRLVKAIAAASVAYYAVDWVLDRYVVKSDAADPTGFVLQAPGFGADDVVRFLSVGTATALGIKFAGGI